MRIPLFPLNTVLYPGGPLKLRVFETRYLEMISDCLRRDARFGVCLIRSGPEVGATAEPHPIGTLAKIVDWEQRKDGLLGITIMGEQRFRLRSHEAGPSQLLLGEVEPIEDACSRQLPEHHQPLQSLLRRIIEQLDGPYSDLPTAYDDANWVSYRLAEILPLPLNAKQELLELEDCLQRLDRVEQLIQRNAANG